MLLITPTFKNVKVSEQNMLFKIDIMILGPEGRRREETNRGSGKEERT
jgi:hypothetical protein